MRNILLGVIVFLGGCGTSYADPQIDGVWDYLAKQGNSSQWAIVSVEGNRGYFQCERQDDYLRCPFPVWSKLLPDTQLYATVAVQSSPYPELDGTRTNSYMNPAQVRKLINLLKDRNLEFAEVYGQLKNEKEEPAGSSYEVVLILELDYANFNNLVETYLSSVWEANTSGGYEIETDR